MLIEESCLGQHPSQRVRIPRSVDKSRLSGSKIEVVRFASEPQLVQMAESAFSYASIGHVELATLSHDDLQVLLQDDSGTCIVMERSL
jgi:hypothetical protein